MNDGWDKLLRAARAMLNEREVSPFVYAGQVGGRRGDRARQYLRGRVRSRRLRPEHVAPSAPPSTPCSPPGEHRVRRVAAVKETGVVPPCGACREALMQLMPDAGKDRNTHARGTARVCTLRELLPDWWGSDRFEEQ